MASGIVELIWFHGTTTRFPPRLSSQVVSMIEPSAAYMEVRCGRVGVWKSSGRSSKWSEADLAVSPTLAAAGSSTPASSRPATELITTKTPRCVARRPMPAKPV